MNLDSMTTRIFADGADLDSIFALASHPRISGFTTNPTLMREAGLNDYGAFARRILDNVTEHPVSFEVIADDLEEMLRQAKVISDWGNNVYTKIPVSTTRGESTAHIVRALSQSGVKVNVTAIFTLSQLEPIVEALTDGAPAFVSIFAGRIADAGVDPIPIVASAVDILKRFPQIEVIWASTREILNLVQANSVGCQIITMSPEVLKKLDQVGRDLSDYSLETVKMFHRDALAAGLTI
jgi:transaldolase